MTPKSNTKLNNFELSASACDVQDFQDAVCVKHTGEDNLGPLDSETRLAIEKALGATDQQMDDHKALQLRRRLRNGVTCPPAT